MDGKFGHVIKSRTITITLKNTRNHLVNWSERMTTIFRQMK